MAIRTGLKTYALRDESGEIVASIRFNPADAGIATRFAEAGDQLGKLINGLDVEANPIELNRVNEEMKNLFDYALTGNRNNHFNSNQLFAYLAPTADIGDGVNYFEEVYRELTDIITPVLEKAAAESAARIEAYTAKYAPAPVTADGPADD